MTQGYLNCSKCGEPSLRVSRVSRYIQEDDRGDPYLNIGFICYRYSSRGPCCRARENRKCYISDEIIEGKSAKKSTKIETKKHVTIYYHCFKCNTNIPSNERVKHLRGVHPDLQQIVYQKTDKYFAEKYK